MSMSDLIHSARVCYEEYQESVIMCIFISNIEQHSAYICMCYKLQHNSSGYYESRSVIHIWCYMWKYLNLNILNIE